MRILKVLKLWRLAADHSHGHVGLGCCLWAPFGAGVGVAAGFVRVKVEVGSRLVGGLGEAGVSGFETVIVLVILFSTVDIVVCGANNPMAEA